LIRAGASLFGVSTSVRTQSRSIRELSGGNAHRAEIIRRSLESAAEIRMKIAQSEGRDPAEALRGMPRDLVVTVPESRQTDKSSTVAQQRPAIESTSK
jgi:hypothetical protein